MRRTIVTPAELSGAALSDLKAWLSITRNSEDDALTDLLNCSAQLCEAFIGQMPMQVSVEESVAAQAGHSRLASTPVIAVNSAEVLEANGTRRPFQAERYEVDICASGRAHICIISAPENARAVIFEVQTGLASDWATLPAPLRQGIIRLAAHQYRDRDQSTPSEIPLTVTALWRPWRSVSLA